MIIGIAWITREVVALRMKYGVNRILRPIVYLKRVRGFPTENVQVCDFPLNSTYTDEGE